MTVSTAAASATVRACGPTVSCVCEIGTTPARLVRPTVGLRPTTPLQARRTDDAAVGFGAQRRRRRDSPTRRRADPELDPQGLRSSAYGLLHLPSAPAPSARRIERAEVRPLAQVGLAEDDGAARRAAWRRPSNHEAPDARPARTIRPSSACDRRCRCCPSAGSGCRAGDQARGPAGEAISAMRACASASGLTSIIELRCGPRSSIAWIRVR